MRHTLSLELLSQTLAVCRLGPEAPVPPWASEGALSAVVRTPDELSVVCEARRVPPDVPAVRGWRALRVAGRLDFEEVGILAALVAPLAGAGVPVFVLSTYETDYVLVEEARLAQALEALTAAGHTVRPI